MLFADLKGSMELLADRDPEEARKLLDPVLERMMEAVHHYEGTVNQVMGDGIMALFGAPMAHEDHAVRACYAALRMQRRVTLYADELQRAGGTPVQIRVGLNSGEVVVRAIGSDLHMDYTAVGQTTHLAARMEQMAKPGSALVTGDTLRLAEGYVQVRPLGAVPVKGLETPTPVYELTGTVPARSRLQASAARGLTRFVGRERELQQLAQALERAAAGHGQAVAVVGEAGVGKSRLVWEFTRSHRTHGWLVLESGSVSYGKATPYLPVIELLKAYCRIQERDDPRAIRERVAGKLLTLDRALEPLLTPLLALLDVPVDDRRVGRPRPATTPAAHPGGGQAAAPPREPGPAAARALRGSPLDRRRDPGAARRPHREPPDGPRPEPYDPHRHRVASARLPEEGPSPILQEDLFTRDDMPLGRDDLPALARVESSAAPGRRVEDLPPSRLRLRLRLGLHAWRLRWGRRNAARRQSQPLPAPRRADRRGTSALRRRHRPAAHRTGVRHRAPRRRARPSPESPRPPPAPARGHSP